jgi:hypothetical protein
MKMTRLILIITILCTIFVIGVRTPESYEEGSITGGGTIKGKVTFKGEVPMRKVVPTKDMEICGGIREDPQIILGSGDGVQDAIVYLKEVPKGKKWSKPAKTPMLTNHNCRFEPHVQVIPEGMNVAIHNSDPVLHNTHGFLIKSTVFNVAMPKQGMSVERPLKKPGIIRVECDSHGWMLGWIYVADNPYYSVTGKDGTFSISEVPAGNYTMVIWQEYMGSKEMQVTVKANETVTVPFEIKK